MIFEIVIPLVLFVAGFFIGQKLFHTSGVMTIDTSNEEKDRWLLTITDPIDDIYTKKTIKIKIERRTLDGNGGIET